MRVVTILFQIDPNIQPMINIYSSLGISGIKILQTSLTYTCEINKELLGVKSPVDNL